MLKCQECGSTGLFERREYVRHEMVVNADDWPVDDSGVLDYGESLGEREYQCLECYSYMVRDY